ncbi:hypothetical protein RBH29_08475 [Herbivorax sp. ANBcel31]|uniref:hypothetical protein n=1 Tax=Herbivorax sp. ANBcel31 TaxID=3069754 RepID=UPI0027B3991D|nr:hypothetical protein [Herbivorax sp. ANBcel31]MDQ2086462.1 hypothetical protein [Herbivorax sp. ANBcel31]
MKLKLYFVLSLLILSLLTGCASKEDKTFTSEDGKFSVIAPSNWAVDIDLNEHASLEISNIFREKYLVVVHESKQELADVGLNMSFNEYSSLIAENMENYLTNGKSSKIETTDSKIRWEIKGTTEDIDITYILTTLDKGDSFYQIIAWTLTSEYKKFEKELTKISDSFTENQ